MSEKLGHKEEYVLLSTNWEQVQACLLNAFDDSDDPYTAEIRKLDEWDFEEITYQVWSKYEEGFDLPTLIMDIARDYCDSKFPIKVDK